MCGRFSFNLTAQIIQDSLDIIISKQLEINFNIAPTHKAYAIMSSSPSKLEQIYWGLIPHWLNIPKLNGKLINARIETITEKPSFSKIIGTKRCIILADSFYEWEKVSKEKYPYRILPKNDKLLFMAAIWDECIINGTIVKTFSIITTKPNDFMKNIHHRMPLILDSEQKRKIWSNPNSNIATLKNLTALENDYLEMYPISNQINSVKNNGIELQRSIPKQGKLF